MSLVRRVAEAHLPAVRAGYADFLPEHEALSQRRHSPFATLLIVVLALMVAAAGAWMHFGEVDDGVAARGLVQTAVPPLAVSHSQGGQVAEVLVAEGEAVRAGQVLLRLDDSLLSDELVRLTAVHRVLARYVDRLMAAAPEEPGHAKAVADAMAERDRHAAELADRQARRERLAVRAPLDGVIRNLKPLGPGAHIAAGEVFARLDPAVGARRMDITIHVADRDVSAIVLGQDAIVKLPAYDWRRHGTVRGKVVSIADAPAMDGRFAVRIALERGHLGDDPQRQRLHPGMKADVYLPTGRHSVVGYLLGGL
jgi:multidrug efflux pump subunit AcrA (membrane-fusion protein)